MAQGLLKLDSLIDHLESLGAMAQPVSESKEKASEESNFNLGTKLRLSQLGSDDTGYFIQSKKDIRTNGKRVFVRVDYNVPMNDSQEITDDKRVMASLPTIRALLETKPRYIVLCSHLGRPKGNNVPKLSLKPVAQLLSKRLEKTAINFITDWFQDDLKDRLEKYDEGSVILLENVRFYIEEEGKGVNEKKEKIKADPDRVKRFRSCLTSISDLYVCDAFGTAHRGHSSMVGVDTPLKCAGHLVTKELTYFEKALSSPESPYLAILGGAKVTDKIKVIESLLDKVDTMIIAGGMCFTFLKVCKSMAIGGSLFDKEGAEIVESLMKKAESKGVKILLPIDFVCGDAFKEECNVKTVSSESGIEDGWLGMDIGPKSIDLFKSAILESKTVVWNGPPGVFEFKPFANGTNAFCDALVEATGKGASTIVGGGDSASAVKKAGVEEKVSHVSTGGGASLELLEGKALPGVVALTDI